MLHLIVELDERTRSGLLFLFVHDTCSLKCGIIPFRSIIGSLLLTFEDSEFLQAIKCEDYTMRYVILEQKLSSLGVLKASWQINRTSLNLG